MQSILINNYEETLWFSIVDHDCYCEHRVPRHVLMWIRSGHLRVERDGEVITAGPGDVIFIRRDCNASIAKLSDGDTPYRSIAVTLGRNVLKGYAYRNVNELERIRRGRLTPIAGAATILPSTMELKSLFHSLVPYADEAVMPSERMLASKIDETIGAILLADVRLHATLFDFQDPWEIDILEFLEGNFTQDLTMEEMASYTGRSLATFKRDFSKVSDTTPQKWLINRRLEYAAQLLSEGRGKPSSVYIASGFRNRTHFLSAFKHKFGHTPSEHYANI